MIASSTGISFEQVSSVALDMLSSGIKPTVRNVLKLTGGKTETVSGYLRDFHNKRDAEVSKMADELGSGAIASLLASEIQIVVDRKTKSLTDIVERQKDQIAEMIELLDEKQVSCDHDIKLTESKSIQIVDEATNKVKIVSERIVIAETEKEQAEKVSIKVQDESKRLVVEANENAERLIDSIKKDADMLVKTADQKSSVLVEASKSEANALVKAANVQMNNAISETQTLRQQVKELTIEQAKYEIEQEQYVQSKEILNTQQIEIADQKTNVVKLQTEKLAFIKDTERLELDLTNAKSVVDKFSQAQAELVSLQKQLSQSQYDLSQSQRERDSLSQALAVSDSKK